MKRRIRKLIDGAPDIEVYKRGNPKEKLCFGCKLVFPRDTSAFFNNRGRDARLLILVLLALPSFAVTKLRMQSAASTVGTYKQLRTQLGSGLTTSVTNSAVSGTLIQWTDTGGGTALSWISAPLAAGATISGTVTLNTWASESNGQCNCGQRVIVKRYTAGAEGSTVTDTSQGTELTTSISNRTWTATPTNTVFSTGDRIVVYWYVTAAGGTMGGNRTVTSDYNGTVNAADGESYVQFNENLTFSFTASAFDTAVPSSGAEVVGRVAALIRADTASAAAVPVLSRLAAFSRNKPNLTVQEVTASDFVTPGAQHFSRSALDTALLSESVSRSLMHDPIITQSIVGLQWTSMNNTDWIIMTNSQWLTLDGIEFVSAVKTTPRDASDTTLSGELVAILQTHIRSAADNGLAGEAVLATTAHSGTSRSVSLTVLPAGSEESVQRSPIAYHRAVAVIPGIVEALLAVPVSHIGPVSLIR